MAKRVISKEELKEIERQERLLAQICWAVRKVYGIREQELRTEADVADLVNLGSARIRADELPKIIAYAIARTHLIELKIIANCSPIIRADNWQQISYRLKQLERKTNLLLGTANQDYPGQRRAILALSMALRLMSSKTLMPVVYE